MDKRIIRSTLACSVALFASAAVYAESIRVYQAGEVPDPRVVARILGAKPAAFASLPKTRGLFYTPDYRPDERAPVEPEIKDGGHTITEEDIAASAGAAVSAWHEKLGRSVARGERGGLMQKVALTQPATTDSLHGDSVSPPTPALNRAPARKVSNPPAREASKPAAREVSNPPAPEASNPTASRKPDSLAVAINFASNSTQLTTESKRAIDSIAEGIKLAGFERKVLVEGHSNATGSNAHNLKLSRLRAEAVKQYLIVNHAIPEAALIAKGLGCSKPLPGMPPVSANNRRVQFRALV